MVFLAERVDHAAEAEGIIFPIVMRLPEGRDLGHCRGYLAPGGQLFLDLDLRLEAALHDLPIAYSTSYNVEGFDLDKPSKALRLTLEIGRGGRVPHPRCVDPTSPEKTKNHRFGIDFVKAVYCQSFYEISGLAERARHIADKCPIGRIAMRHKVDITQNFDLDGVQADVAGEVGQLSGRRQLRPEGPTSSAKLTRQLAVRDVRYLDRRS